MRRRCGRVRCRRVDNASLIHRYELTANTISKKGSKKGTDLFYWPYPSIFTPHFPRPGRRVSPCTASHFLLSGQEKVTKEKATPTSGSGLRRLPSLQCCSGGRLTRAILGPLSLSPHPCGSSPYAAPPLGLLKGIGVRVARESFGLSISSVRTGRRHEPPLQEGERNRRGRG